MRKLSDIFKTNNREARRKILDKFDITAADKNEVLNKIATNSIGGGGEVNSGFRYKSNKVVWEIDYDKVDEIANETIFYMYMGISIYIPIYCVCISEREFQEWWDRYFYGFGATGALNYTIYQYLTQDGNPSKPKYIEEAESVLTHNSFGKIKIEGVRGLMALVNNEPIEEITDEWLYQNLALKRIDYNEYVAIRKGTDKYENFLE